MVVWVLLDPGDAEAIRAEVASGRHWDACGLLLNRALELLSLAEANPEFADSRPATIDPVIPPAPHLTRMLADNWLRRRMRQKSSVFGEPPRGIIRQDG